MPELINCPSCNELFVKNQFRDVCPACWKEEEEDFQTVYHFMRKRENRAATIDQIMTQTGVKEEMIFKFVKIGRLKTLHFPNLGYPCDKCGRIIQKGRLCDDCSNDLRDGLEQFEKEEQRKREILEREKGVYYSQKTKGI